jgi:hypothetical protein
MVRISFVASSTIAAFSWTRFAASGQPEHIQPPTSIVDRVNELESDFKEYRKTNDARVSSLQRLVYIGLGILLAIQFILIVYVTYLKQ